MQKIKNRTWGILLGLGCLLWAWTGCEKFLDVPPVGLVIPETPEEVRAMLVNAYESYPSDLGKLEMRSDLVTLREVDPTDVATFGDMYIWNEKQAQPSAALCEWRAYYKTIYLANHVIEHFAERAASDEKYAQLVGEAYALRAYAHFTLVNIYGEPYSEESKGALGVPLVLSTDTQVTLGRSTLEEVYTQVQKDIEQAQAHMQVTKWDEAVYRYRFSGDAVLAFKARVALYMGEWAQCVEVSKELLTKGYALTDLVSNRLQSPAHFQSEEMIMALDLALGDREYGAMLPSEELLQFYDKAGDLRYKTYFRTKEGVTRLKRDAKEGSKAYRSTFRLAEVYLNLAEAYAQQELLSEAREALYTLQAVRLEASYREEEKTKLEAADQAALLAYINTERAREMPLEGHRWFTLRRTQRPAVEHVFENSLHLLEENDARYTLPIPKVARDNNKLL